ncbi:CheY chemotaxis protein or a CheY-like REC (receiver) domain [Desulfocicer vacuolatum DSM 3385]|uniref:CheY chemotaxis protein or a CheY-like REC (Receiver) domain n=1 Tax=Desulfocicer vacuolatum DSM 3385 TaxID=1121400 RepID=A0A1W2AKS9_9BACT|nr:response regulator [Desulfocicer vacuolatum]SMC61224.1 CheY chemotaxis protein or a CheY-like REC (receiver) domain [Desulfocicer vacuolatum DSM 3385]
MGTQMNDSDEFDDLFVQEFNDEDGRNIFQNSEKQWKILVVDDDEDVHAVTRLALQGFSFQGKNLIILEAHSDKSAREILKDHPDIALMLVDVVMESDTAGLNLVDYVRNELKNESIRIVLRTGQPGVAPEQEVIREYEIDDYKSKTELTSEKLFTAMMVGLRTYEAMNTREHYQKKLEQEVAQRTASLQQALDEIKMLRGIIPICSNCKKIRDDDGCWRRFEAYIQKYSEAQFSHSICPDCARKLYPDFHLDDD